MFVQEYYQELQKGMLRCGVVADEEDHIVRFYGGLWREIQDIVDYKEYYSIQCLFQLAMLAEKELQGHQQQQWNNTFTPRQFPTPAKVAPSSSVRAATPPSTGVVRNTAPSTSKGQVSNKSRHLLVLQQRLWCPTLSLVAPPTSSATAARDLAICSEIALANG
jgi:hypothetical protein